MAEPFEGAIVISHNPVTAWESYHQTLDPDPDYGFSGLKLSKRAMGGYWESSFRVVMDESFAVDLFENGLSRDVKIFSPKAATVWNGLVYEVELDYGRAKVRGSLAPMINRAWLRYRVSGTTTTTRSTKQNDTTSQGQYGIKEGAFNAGELEGSTEADQIVSRILGNLKNPSFYPVEFNAGADLNPIPIVTVNCKGYCWTLKWRTYNQTASTGPANLAAVMTNVVDTCGEYIASYTIPANATQVEQEMDSDRVAFDLVSDLANMGDSNGNRFVWGVWDDRHFEYEQAIPPTEAA